MAEALVVRNVSVRRGASVVVQDVSFTTSFGSLLAIVGPNGAGKSSLLKTLAALLPCTGNIESEGDSVADLSARARARRIAYVPQQALLRAHLSVRSVVAQGRHAHRAWSLREPTRPEPAVERALEVSGLTQHAERSFLRLSGGEQRRVLLARAIASEARVILLDEPTAGLDVAHELTFHALLRQLVAEGACVVSVMHDLADVRRVADQALLLRAGRLVAAGPVREVISPEPIADVYAVRMEENASLRFHLAERAP